MAHVHEAEVETIQLHVMTSSATQPNIFTDISERESAAISSLTSGHTPAASCRMLCRKQEIALAGRADNNRGGGMPLNARHVSRSDDSERQDPINAASEVPFLVTVSELRDRKIERRQKSNAQRRR
jgi:hypothetical protein